jgi:hypothetical protein
MTAPAVRWSVNIGGFHLNQDHVLNQTYRIIKTLSVQLSVIKFCKEFIVRVFTLSNKIFIYLFS